MTEKRKRLMDSIADILYELDDEQLEMVLAFVEELRMKQHSS